MVAHVVAPSTREAEAGGFLEFEASLVYRVRFRTARATQRNPVSKNQKKKKREPEAFVSVGTPWVQILAILLTNQLPQN